MKSYLFYAGLFSASVIVSSQITAKPLATVDHYWPASMMLSAIPQEPAFCQMRDQAMETKLNSKVYFDTGKDDIGLPGAAKLEPLVQYLRANPSMVLELNGFADPRGSDEYNYVLSQQRALAVKQHLQALGVNAKRIRYNSYGADCSLAAKGDLQAYAQERRVDVYIYQPNTLPKEATAMVQAKPYLSPKP